MAVKLKLFNMRITSWMLTFVEIIAVLLIAYLTLGGALYFMQPKFTYSPTREVSYAPDELGLDFENVVFKTGDGVQLSSWFVPAEESGLTVLFCHGNGGNMMHRLDSIDILHNLGLGCFIFDYRGYGDSEGKPSEEGTYLDAMAAYNWLTKVKNVPANRIIIFGRSLGGSIAAQLAGKVDAGALIIESGFTSYVDMGRKFYPYMPVRWFARFSYSTIDYIRKVRCPVLIIHSRNDEIVPFEFGLELYEAANEPKEFVELFGSHNGSFLVSREIYNRAWAKWLKFLEQYYEGRSAGQQAC
ncbi:MAG: alpha/beta hydrolase [Planctomycetota bacterium]|nr:MAG: alpha/beta hydrolase [Planctomycetota bacterium]